MKINKKLLAALGTAALLAACGGDDHAPSATERVSPSASTSSAGFIAYLQELVASSADNLRPVDVSGVTPPLDDTGTPTSIN